MKSVLKKILLVNGALVFILLMIGSGAKANCLAHDQLLEVNLETVVESEACDFLTRAFLLGTSLGEKAFFPKNLNELANIEFKSTENQYLAYRIFLAAENLNFDSPLDKENYWESNEFLNTYSFLLPALIGIEGDPTVSKAKKNIYRAYTLIKLAQYGGLHDSNLDAYRGAIGAYMEDSALRTTTDIFCFVAYDIPTMSFKDIQQSTNFKQCIKT